MARPRKRSESDLSRFLDPLIARSGLTHNEFGEKVGLSSSSLSDLKLRQEGRAPSREMVHRWAEVLHLSKGEEHELFELLQLAHTPRYVQDLLAKWRPHRPDVRVAESERPYRVDPDQT